jgi:drug/metabolite transporter (DMT)-like permease
VLAALLCTCLFSFSIVCGHRSARLIGGTEANFWRLVVAGICLGAWAFGFGRGLDGAAFPLFLLSGIVGIGIGDLGLFQALPRLGSRLSVLLIQCLTAPLGALVEWLWLGTALHASQIICGLVVLTGVGLALLPSEHLRIERRVRIAGTGFSLLAAVGGAWGAVLSRKAYEVAHLNQQPIDGGNAAFQRIVGGLLVAAIGVLVVKRRALRIQAQTPPALVLQAAKHKWRGVWPWVLANGVAGQTFGVSCMQWALETTPTGIVLAIIAMTPIAVIPFAALLEGERPTTHSVVGGIIAVAGVIGLVLVK